MERIEGEGMDFTLALGSLEDQEEGVNGNSGITISSLPGNVNLSSISQSESIVTINGWAPSEKDVLSYVRNLDDSAQFSEITITGMKRIEDEGMEFTLANHLFLKTKTTLKAGTGYSVDLLGASLSSILASAILIPLLGIPTTLIMVLLINLICLGFLLIPVRSLSS